MTFTIWNVTFLKNELFMSYQRFKKGDRVAKSVQIEDKSCIFVHFYFIIVIFAHEKSQAYRLLRNRRKNLFRINQLYVYSRSTVETMQ